MLVELAEKGGFLETEGQGAQVRLRVTEKGRAVATSTRGVDEPGSPVAALDNPSGTRSDAFLTLWKGANLGPFHTVRTAVYDEIDRSIKGGSTTLKALVSDAVKAVRASEAEASPKFPWSRVTQFIETLMRRRPVALSDGKPVALD